MNKKDELAKFILENPSLPLVFFISGEDILDEYSSTVYEDFSFRKATVYFFGERVYDHIIDISEVIADCLYDEDMHGNMTDEQFDKWVASYIEENVKHYEAIVITVG